MGYTYGWSKWNIFTMRHCGDTWCQFYKAYFQITSSRKPNAKLALLNFKKYIQCIVFFPLGQTFDLCFLHLSLYLSCLGIPDGDWVRLKKKTNHKWNLLAFFHFNSPASHYPALHQVCWRINTFKWFISYTSIINIFSWWDCSNELCQKNISRLVLDRPYSAKRFLAF